MVEQKNQTPRKGWIYIIDPQKVYLTCKLGHTYSYNIEPLDYVECHHPSCKHTVNPSRVLRGKHPYIVLTSEKFLDQSGYIKTFNAIPLTSQKTYKGLPTAYPINPTAKNCLDKKSFALVHQICTIDANYFKDREGKWKKRVGQLDKEDREEIGKRLTDLFDLEPDDWFTKNASPELLIKIMYKIPENERHLAIERLIDEFTS
ncbi:type II toxin-antitoxin system PemK/MazF family toxin [Dapis sp. BLCC M229]|uniref:type II toxin-antitoxin system PemK/MazF family toxin n=1 Tax=Dapis sp. BLCC M229 TaxID=3400188 RepID=UPI003CF3074A